jgi:hypothetical protein
MQPFPKPDPKPYKPKRKPSDVGYHRGALVALAALHAWDGPSSVAYKEVLVMFDLNELLHVARREGQMRWSGLSEYVRRKQNPKVPVR